MSSLSNKRILLGVTGGIAAYKSAELVRKFIALGANVRVVMTEAAQGFITPLTMQALSGNPVHTALLDEAAEAAMGHIELARWADAIVIAPCTADFIAKIVSGEASDLLSTLYLAHSGVKVIAPAMNQAMWAAEATQENIQALAKRDVHICGPASGEQACGDVGLGRMEEPEAIAEFCACCFESGHLAGKHVVITAGPTREPIDPVRYISNHSSGKMGYALAQAAIEAGARVTLISGPVNLASPDRVELVEVETAMQMRDAAVQFGANADLFIGAAAVADYRVVEVAQHKIKKAASHGADDGHVPQSVKNGMQLNLVENPDIISEIASLYKDTVVVGFAAETQNVVAYARQKLERKQLDFIVANDVSDQSIGFNSDDNAVTLVSKIGEQYLDIQNKSSLARRLLQVLSLKA